MGGEWQASEQFWHEDRRDLSAGMWRYLHYSSERITEFIIIMKGENISFVGIYTFWLNCGLGRYGIDLAERAEKFTGTGFCPAVEKISDGFCGDGVSG